MTTLDTTALKTQLETISAKANEIYTDLKSRLDASDKEVKGALAKQDGLLQESIAKQAQEVAKIAEDLQSVKANLETAQKLDSAADELKYYNGSLKKSSKEAMDHFIAYLRSGLDQDIGKAMHAIMKKDLVVNDNPNGGFLVPAQMASFIATRPFEGDPMRMLARAETISSDALVVPLDDQDFGSSWIGETQTRTNTPNATLGELRIDAHEHYASVPVSLKMLEDSSVDIMRWVGDKLADRFARAEGITFINGNGVGRPRGLLTYANWSVAGTYQSNALERVNLGNATALTADGLVGLQNTLKQEFQGNASWIMNRTTYGRAMLLKDGMGQYLFNNIPNSAGVFQPGLLSKPVYFGASMPAVAANALSVAYGDFRQGYCIVDRVGMTMLNDPYSVQGFVVVKARKRTGGGVIGFDAVKIGVVAA